jgi:hypothetical protein
LHVQEENKTVMTRLIVNSGACGFLVAITAERGAGGKIAISLDTDCGMVREMLEDIATLDKMASFAGILNNPVYKSASKHLKHPACPVPAAILKALEVEAGLNVPKNVTIAFEKKK